MFEKIFIKGVPEIVALWITVFFSWWEIALCKIVFLLMQCVLAMFRSVVGSSWFPREMLSFLLKGKTMLNKISECKYIIFKCLLHMDSQETNCFYTELLSCADLWKTSYQREPFAIYFIITALINVFTPVCHSVHGRVCMRSLPIWLPGDGASDTF